MTNLLNCGHAPSKHGPYTTGYGTIDGKRQCYDCCAAIERQAMVDTGRATLYLTFDDDTARYIVTDWPGHLRFICTRHTSSPHNIGRKQEHVWFTGPDGKWWHGYHVGDFNQIVHCRRLKVR